MIKKIYLASFFFSFQVALTAYVNSTYLSKIAGENKVGLIYGLASFIAILALGIIPKVINKIGNKKSIIYSLLISGISLSFLAQTNNPILGVLFFITYLSANILVYFCFDILIEHFSKDGNTGSTRGAYLSLNNMAWVGAPIIGGLFIVYGGFKLNYAFASVIIMFSMLVLALSIKNYTDVKYERKPLRESLRQVWQTKHLRAIISLNFILQFFFSWMVIYGPLYLIQYGNFSWHSLSIIFSIMLSAFVIIEYSLGKLVDKGIDGCHLMALGFIIAGIFTLIFSKSIHHPVIIVALILFMTRVGAATIESMAEIYFFKHITDSDTHLLSLFRDMNPLAYIVGPVSATLLLCFISLPSLFLILSIILFLAVLIIPQLHSYEYKK